MRAEKESGTRMIYLAGRQMLPIRPFLPKSRGGDEHGVGDMELAVRLT